MACAGYLILNNTTPVYAEITNGLLVCASATYHRKEQRQQDDEQPEEEAQPNDAPAPHSLPLLELKRMVTSDSPAVPKLKTHEGHDHNGQSDQERVLCLSGSVVDVIDCDEMDNASTAIAFSFQVQTKKLVRHADGTFTVTSVDSVLLAAVCQLAKDQWMARLARWHRYAWRDTTPIAATKKDLEVLAIRSAQWSETECTAAIEPTAFRQPTPRRRKFYYQAPGYMAYTSEPSGTNQQNDPWFQMRVVKTHI